MAEPDFGNPESVRGPAQAPRAAASELDRLVQEVNRDVRSTVPEAWSGEASQMFLRFWERLFGASPGSPLDAYGQELEVAANIMTEAQQQLEGARQLGRQHPIRIQPDLSIVAMVTPPSAGFDAVIRAARERLERAARLLEEARWQINRVDNLAADRELARRFGWRDEPGGPTAAKQVERWRNRADNDFVWHHYSDHEMTLVRRRLHRSIHHSGSAQEMR